MYRYLGTNSEADESDRRACRSLLAAQGQREPGGTFDKWGLIKDLVRLRLSSDPHSATAGFDPRMVESLSDFELLGLPEATIVTIVETWAIGTLAGIPDAEIFARIEDYRSLLLPRRELPVPLSLTDYVKYRLALEYPPPIGELFVESAVKLAKEAYGV